ncbi:hypothetical protein [Caballeronia sp. 15715]|uniref:hypothetical protein n=1 Tax=unclassified Caballeronia TaxID=2646786 RepID=UPI0039E4AF9B
MRYRSSGKSEGSQRYLQGSFHGALKEFVGGVKVLFFKDFYPAETLKPNFIFFALRSNFSFTRH